MNDARPNILLILVDQHRADCLGANGHPLLRTPHLDGLAASGTNFEHAYTPIPLCVPARNCLVYGQWSFQHGVLANTGTEAGRPAPFGRPAVTRLLADSGYQLGHVGKWHVDHDHGPEEYGFSISVPEGDYWGWREEQGYAPRTMAGNWFGATDSAIPAAASRLAWGADRTIESLGKLSQGDSPFFMMWTPSEPHLPNMVPSPFAEMYAPESIPPWPSFPDSLQGKPYIQRQQRRTWRIDDWTWDQWAPVVGRYLGEISLIDQQVGRVLDALEAHGLSQNTVVVYTSDHGDMCGAHGMIDKHYVMYDDIVRVPLIVRWPGEATPGAVCRSFVTHALDLAATLCDIAGIPVPDAFQGQSVRPLVRGDDTGREDIFSAYHGAQFGLYSQRMVRDQRWKYIWNPTAEDELYDLQDDPGELRNLAQLPDDVEQLQRLRSRLVEWMEETGDPILNGWTRAQLLEGLKA
ncbi:MAG: sulfatase-like hydrolase/transferase [Lentisphaerae bacterium]|nr:sulfatase-like hydrolase/transferase [Lentisphaerota bacterium]MBT4818632.1 sulfatase-like hydrolase/transferase [Lentisphaerota bacterium]MBT5606893.1 sulfatase-like hydrolase/transferase [Lentisphaerota bacterium]MBT7058339.1 sulfatase-like hydrolase/transferase [Lentisphaerota bacterium]MBT7843612.1 sulfatase-like hydrolase/transferase [Lentisphaerota bacterium]